MVTGGASGMGRSICEQLAARGDRVAVLDIDAAAAHAVADDLRDRGARGTGVPRSTSPTGRRSTTPSARCARELGPVEILVTSAGIVAFEPFLEVTLESWNRVIEVNLTGTFHCVQATIPDMVAAGWGRIVTISSSSAQRGSPRMAQYAASKGGVIALTKTLAREFAPHGITVNNIPPSSIETPMQHQGQADGLSPVQRGDGQDRPARPVGHR